MDSIGNVRQTNISMDGMISTDRLPEVMGKQATNHESNNKTNKLPEVALSLVTVGSISYDSDFKVKYSQVRGPFDEATLRGLLTSRWS